MHVETQSTSTVPAAASPCLAHHGERIFSRACRSCPAFALTCFPPHPQAKSAPVTVETAE